jgi:hypothetical protein
VQAGVPAEDRHPQVLAQAAPGRIVRVFKRIDDIVWMRRRAAAPIAAARSVLSGNGDIGPQKKARG